MTTVSSVTGYKATLADAVGIRKLSMDEEFSTKSSAAKPGDAESDWGCFRGCTISISISLGPLVAPSKGVGGACAMAQWHSGQSKSRAMLLKISVIQLSARYNVIRTPRAIFSYPTPIPAKISWCFLWSRLVLLESANSETLG